MHSYEHNFAGTSWNMLYVAFDFGNGDGSDSPDYFNVTETFVDTAGVRIPGKDDNHFFIEKGASYNGHHSTIDGYEYVGYKLDTWDGTYEPGQASIPSVNDDLLVYYVYRAEAGKVNVTVSKVVTGHFINKSKEFTFTVYLKDENDQALEGTIHYEGGTVSGMAATAPMNGALTLNDGKVAFILKHGQTITLLDVPADAMIRVEETVESNYSPSYVDSTGANGTTNDTGFSVVSANGTTARTFEFFNKQNVDPVPTGIADNLRETGVIAELSALLILSVWITMEMISRRLV